jgi:uncharacterized membrane protein
MPPDEKDPPAPQPALPALTRVARVGLLAVLEATSAGLAVWALSAHAQLPRYARDNGLGWEGRRFVFYDMGAGLAVAAAVVAALVAWKRREALAVVERLARRLSPLALSGLAPFLFDARLWTDWPLVFLPLAALFGSGAWASAHVVLTTPPAFPALRARWEALLARTKRRAALPAIRVDGPLVVVVAAACAYAMYFATITIAAHRNLHTSAFDMGLEDNLMWNLVHGGPLFHSGPFSGPTGSHLSNHATFFSYVLAPLYRAAPHPETLLAVQATLMGAAAVPLHLYARRHLPRWTSALVALLYLAYPGLHGANLYDFHYLPLGVVFVWLVLYAVEARRHALTVVAAVLALSVREDVAFCVGVLGVFFVLRGEAVRRGALLALAGGGYFLVMKLGVMPRFAAGHESFLNQYSGLLGPEQKGFGGVLETALGNPVYTGHVLFEQDKLVYVLQLLVPVLFVPLTRPIGILLVVPGLLFTLLATAYPPLNQISFQYTSYWTAFVFIGVVLALERAREARHPGEGGGIARQRALAVGLVAATLACSYLYGAVLQRGTARGGFEPFPFGTTDVDRTRRAELGDLLKELPADASVSGSEHLLPQVSGRRDAYTLRFGIYDAEYLLLQLPMRGDERDKVVPVLRDGTFGVVVDRPDMVLAKRGAPTTGNAAVLSR